MYLNSLSNVRNFGDYTPSNIVVEEEEDESRKSSRGRGF
jgi:hypothetical protein